jgi:hypothetical protein
MFPYESLFRADELQSTRVTIDNPETVARIASFFPQLEEETEKWNVGPIRPLVMNFTFRNGEVIQVVTNCYDWSDFHSPFLCKPGLKKYLTEDLKLFAELSDELKDTSK